MLKTMSKKHIYLVRHGQSNANLTGIREGGESPLTEKGEEQAIFVAERFKTIPIDLVLSSHYKRAYDTGKRIATASKVPLEVVQMAHERELPERLHGKHRDDPEVLKALAEFEYSWIHDSKLDEGEHFNDILERVKTLTKLIEERPEQRIAVASHGFFTKFFVCYHILGDYFTPDLFINSVMHSMRSSNTGITYFTVDEKKVWTLSSWNDYAHLGSLVAPDPSLS